MISEPEESWHRQSRGMLLLNREPRDEVTILLHFSILMSSISLNKMFAIIKSESPDLLSAGGPDEFKKKQKKKHNALWQFDWTRHDGTSKCVNWYRPPALSRTMHLQTGTLVRLCAWSIIVTNLELQWFLSETCVLDISEPTAEYDCGSCSRSTSTCSS